MRCKKYEWVSKKQRGYYKIWDVTLLEINWNKSKINFRIELFKIIYLPAVWPTISTLSCAILSATEIALILLGWVTTRLMSAPVPLSIAASKTNWGICVVLPDE